jgi:mRNA interferase RelE/StbE
MARYRVEIKKSAVKEIERLPRRDMKMVLEKIEALSENPRPPDCKKLSAQEKYRVRCGNYRILYSIEDDVLIVFVVKVGHRKDVYRGN